MKKKFSVIEVKIALDPVPGWGNKPEDHVKWLQDELTRRAPWYHPEVRLIGTEEREVKWD